MRIGLCWGERLFISCFYSLFTFCRVRSPVHLFRLQAMHCRPATTKMHHNDIKCVCVCVWDAFRQHSLYMIYSSHILHDSAKPSRRLACATIFSADHFFLPYGSYTGNIWIVTTIHFIYIVHVLNTQLICSWTFWYFFVWCLLFFLVCVIRLKCVWILSPICVNVSFLFLFTAECVWAHSEHTFSTKRFVLICCCRFDVVIFRLMLVALFIDCHAM